MTNVFKKELHLRVEIYFWRDYRSCDKKKKYTGI